MKLSIITVNLNNRDGLQKTIDSVICQTFRDFEWIVIDGGSTDGSKELIEKYSSHFAYWVSEPDKGIYNAMNKGIMVSKGEYLQFLNSGDMLVNENTLSQLFQCNYTESIVYGYMLRNSIDGNTNNSSMMKPILDWSDFFYDTLPHQSTFIKKIVFDTIGLYDESYKALADWKFFIDAIVYHNFTYIFTPQKISIYEGGGISDGELGLKERCRLREEMYFDKLYADQEVLYRARSIRKNKLLRRIFNLLYRVSRHF